MWLQIIFMAGVIPYTKFGFGIKNLQILIEIITHRVLNYKKCTNKDGVKPDIKKLLESVWACLLERCIGEDVCYDLVGFGSGFCQSETRPDVKDLGLNRICGLKHIFFIYTWTDLDPNQMLTDNKYIIYIHTKVQKNLNIL